MKLGAHKETAQIGELLLDALWRKDVGTLKTLLADSRFHRKSLAQNLSQSLHEKIGGMLHEAKDNEGFTPLHLIKSYDVCTQVLLDHKADIDAEIMIG